MKRFGFILLLAGLGLLVSALADAKAFVSKPGRFSFDFPSTPEEEDNAVGKILRHTVWSELGHDSVFVLYMDLPDDGGGTPAERIDQLVRRELGETHNDVVSPVTTCDRGAILCRAVTFTYTPWSEKGKWNEYLRVYLVGRRLYLSYVVTPAEHGMPSDKARLILDSMKIDEK